MDWWRPRAAPDPRRDGSAFVTNRDSFDPWMSNRGQIAVKLKSDLSLDPIATHREGTRKWC